MFELVKVSARNDFGRFSRYITFQLNLAREFAFLRKLLPINDEQPFITDDEGLSKRIVGTTRRLLNFFGPASGGGIPGCSGGWITASLLIIISCVEYSFQRSTFKATLTPEGCRVNSGSSTIHVKFLPPFLR